MRAHLVERTEPTHVASGLEIRTSAGLAENGLGGIVTRAAGSAEIDGAAHAELDVVDTGGGDLQRMLHLGSEVLGFVLRSRVLQVVHGAAVADRAQPFAAFQARLGTPRA